MGEDVLAKDGDGFYGAVILRKKGSGKDEKFLLHYYGWNKRYDKWLGAVDVRPLSAESEPDEEDVSASVQSESGSSSKALSTASSPQHMMQRTMHPSDVFGPFDVKLHEQLEGCPTLVRPADLVASIRKAATKQWLPDKLIAAMLADTSTFELKSQCDITVPAKPKHGHLLIVDPTAYSNRNWYREDGHDWTKRNAFGLKQENRLRNVDWGVTELSNCLMARFKEKTVVLKCYVNMGAKDMNFRRRIYSLCEGVSDNTPRLVMVQYFNEKLAPKPDPVKKSKTAAAPPPSKAAKKAQPPAKKSASEDSGAGRETGSPHSPGGNAVQEKRRKLLALLDDETVPLVFDYEPSAPAGELEVIIIGAGAAGLAAAAQLQKAGVNPLVLEGRERIGGRILTHTLPARVALSESETDDRDAMQTMMQTDDQLRPSHANQDLLPARVDLGAAYVHGCGPTNSLYVLARKAGIKIDTRGGGYSEGWGAEGGVWHDMETGSPISRRDIRRAWEILTAVWDQLQDTARMAEALVPDGQEPADTNLREAYDTALQQVMADPDIAEPELTRVQQQVLQCSEVVAFAYVASMDELSFLANRGLHSNETELMAALELQMASEAAAATMMSSMGESGRGGEAGARDGGTEAEGEGEGAAAGVFHSEPESSQNWMDPGAIFDMLRQFESDPDLGFIDEYLLHPPDLNCGYPPSGSVFFQRATGVGQSGRLPFHGDNYNWASGGNGKLSDSALREDHPDVMVDGQPVLTARNVQTCAKSAVHLIRRVYTLAEPTAVQSTDYSSTTDNTAEHSHRVRMIQYMNMSLQPEQRGTRSPKADTKGGLYKDKKYKGKAKGKGKKKQQQLSKAAKARQEKKQQSPWLTSGAEALGVQPGDENWCRCGQEKKHLCGNCTSAEQGQLRVKRSSDFLTDVVRRWRVQSDGERKAWRAAGFDEVVAMVQTFSSTKDGPEINRDSAAVADMCLDCGSLKTDFGTAKTGPNQWCTQCAKGHCIVRVADVDHRMARIGRCWHGISEDERVAWREKNFPELSLMISAFLNQAAGPPEVGSGDAPWVALVQKLAAVKAAMKKTPGKPISRCIYGNDRDFEITNTAKWCPTCGIVHGGSNLGLPAPLGASAMVSDPPSLLDEVLAQAARSPCQDCAKVATADDPILRSCSDCVISRALIFGPCEDCSGIALYGTVDQKVKRWCKKCADFHAVVHDRGNEDDGTAAGRIAQAEAAQAAAKAASDAVEAATAAATVAALGFQFSGSSVAQSPPSDGPNLPDLAESTVLMASQDAEIGRRPEVTSLLADVTAMRKKSAEGRLCEDCGKVSKNYGRPDEKKVRWCGTCADKHGAILLSKAKKQQKDANAPPGIAAPRVKQPTSSLCEDCGIRWKRYGTVREKVKRWCGDCAKSHGNVPVAAKERKNQAALTLHPPRTAQQPWWATQPPSLQAEVFLNTVKARYTANPLVFGHFLKLLEKLQQSIDKPSVAAVSGEIAVLFTGQPDLLEGFRRFIQPNAQRQHANAKAKAKLGTAYCEVCNKRPARRAEPGGSDPEDYRWCGYCFKTLQAAAAADPSLKKRKNTRMQGPVSKKQTRRSVLEDREELVCHCGQNHPDVDCQSMEEEGSDESKARAEFGRQQFVAPGDSLRMHEAAPMDMSDKHQPAADVQMPPQDLSPGVSPGASLLSQTVNSPATTEDFLQSLKQFGERQLSAGTVSGKQESARQAEMSFASAPAASAVTSGGGGSSSSIEQLERLSAQPCQVALKKAGTDLKPMVVHDTMGPRGLSLESDRFPRAIPLQQQPTDPSADAKAAAEDEGREAAEEVAKLQAQVSHIPPQNSQEKLVKLEGASEEVGKKTYVEVASSTADGESAGARTPTAPMEEAVIRAAGEVGEAVVGAAGARASDVDTVLLQSVELSLGGRGHSPEHQPRDVNAVRRQPMSRKEAVESAAEAGQEDAGLWEVDRVLESRTTGTAGLEYLVSWLGYPASDRSWEPATNLRGARDALAEFGRRGSNAAAAATLSSSRAGLWKVDQVLDRRTPQAGGPAGPEYLVSWVGYPASDNSWEPSSNLTAAQEAIETFNRGQSEMQGGLQGRLRSRLQGGLGADEALAAEVFRKLISADTGHNPLQPAAVLSPMPLEALAEMSTQELLAQVADAQLLPSPGLPGGARRSRRQQAIVPPARTGMIALFKSESLQIKMESSSVAAAVDVQSASSATQCGRSPLCIREPKHRGHCKLAAAAGSKAAAASVAASERRPKRVVPSSISSGPPKKKSHKKKCGVCGVPGCRACPPVVHKSGPGRAPSQRVYHQVDSAGVEDMAEGVGRNIKVEGSSKKRKAAEPTTDQETDETRAPDGLVVHGYCQVIKLLSENQHILTSTVVKSVVAQPDGSVKVSAANGASWTAKYVICTLPLGVLKGWADQTAVSFCPPLSQPKQLAISSLGMGTENKVVLRFARPWWPDRDSPYAKKAYLQCTDHRFRFLDLDRHGKTGLLVAHVSPPFGVDYGGLSDAEMVEEVLLVVKRMFPALLPLPPLVDTIVTRWRQDPFSCGAYSFYATGSSYHSVTALRRPEWPENLPAAPRLGGGLTRAQEAAAAAATAGEAALLVAEEEDTEDKLTYGVHGERLYFAGEACSTSAMQCVSGAVETGQRAGRRIASLL